MLDLSAGPAPSSSGTAPSGTASPATPPHVWYVSYGSNLLRARFEVYLLGGTVAGLDRTYPGGPRTAPASGERAVVLPGRLRFAGDAPKWGGGGVAFWVPDLTGAGVLARAWRVTLQQYLEVVHLENGGTDRVAAPWPDAVLRDGSAVLDEGWYGRLVHVGAIDSEPALTFTSPVPGALPARPPSVRYAGTVARGVVETFAGPGRGALTPSDAQAYVAGYSEG